MYIYLGFFDNPIFILATNIFDEKMKVKVERDAGVELSTTQQEEQGREKFSL